MPGGKSGGSGQVDYLLGRGVTGKGQRCLQGNPEEVRELIDATPFAKKIHVRCSVDSRRRSCRREDVKKVMASFERVLMPGLEKKSVQHPVGGAPGQGTAS